MNILKKEDGTFSKINIFNTLIFLLGVIEIVRPYVPEEYISLVIVGAAVVNLYLRTFQSTGQSIKGASN